MSENNETLSINGTVEGIIYSNDENGYTIFDLGTEDGQTIELYSIEAFKITVDE